MELFKDIKDVHLLAAELKRRYPHLAEEIDFIKSHFVLDKLELEEALYKLRRLAAAEVAGFLVNLRYEEGYSEVQDTES